MEKDGTPVETTEEPSPQKVVLRLNSTGSALSESAPRYHWPIGREELHHLQRLCELELDEYEWSRRAPAEGFATIHHPSPLGIKEMRSEGLLLQCPMPGVKVVDSVSNTAVIPRSLSVSSRDSSSSTVSSSRGAVVPPSTSEPAELQQVVVDSNVNYFARLPDDVLEEILGFLPGISVASAARVCKRFHQHARTEHVWLQACLREWGDPPQPRKRYSLTEPLAVDDNGNPVLMTVPQKWRALACNALRYELEQKIMYADPKRYFETQLRLRRTIQRNMEDKAAQVRAQKNADWRLAWQRMAVGWMIPWLCAVLVWLVIIMIPLKLDSALPTSSLFPLNSPPWVIVCLPLWIAGVLLLFGVIVALAKAKDSFLISVQQKGMTTGITILITVFMSMAVLAAVKADNPDPNLPFSWFVVFIPAALMLAFALAANLTLLRFAQSPADKARLWFAFVCLILTTFGAALHVMKLNGDITWSWFAVLAPIWLLNITPTIFAFTTCCRAPWWPPGLSSPTQRLMPLLLFQFILIFPMLTELLLVLKAEIPNTVSSFTIAWTPMYIAASLLMIVLLFALVNLIRSLYRDYATIYY